MTLLIVDLLQYCVCCIRSDITQCTLFRVLYLYRMCHCRLHTVLWSHIGVLIGIFAAEFRSTARLLFLTQCVCGTILLTLYFDEVGLACSNSRASAFYWPMLLAPFLSSTFFSCPSSFYRLVLLGWDLGNDRVQSQPCTADRF